MNNYNKGRAREYRSMAILEAAGCDAFRMAGSHGAWDVIGVSDMGVVLVQCKLNVWPTKDEIEAMKQARCPTTGLKMLHYYTRGRHAPEVIMVNDLKG